MTDGPLFATEAKRLTSWRRLPIRGRVLGSNCVPTSVSSAFDYSRSIFVATLSKKSSKPINRHSTCGLSCMHVILISAKFLFGFIRLHKWSRLFGNCWILGCCPWDLSRSWIICWFHRQNECLSVVRSDTGRICMNTISSLLACNQFTVEWVGNWIGFVALHL